MECKSIEVTYILENWLFRPSEAKKLKILRSKNYRKKISTRIGKSRILAA